MIVNYEEVFRAVEQATKILLVETPYKRRYIPLGLAKLWTLAEALGKEVEYSRGYRRRGEDLVLATTMFSYEWPDIKKELDRALVADYHRRVIVGGIAATLLADKIGDLLPAVDVFPGYSKELDGLRPAYDAPWIIDDMWRSTSYVFTSRGCPNACRYCAVRIIEPEGWVNDRWKIAIDEDRPFVWLGDNNLTAQPREHLRDVCSTLSRLDKRVAIDSGVDCKHIDDEVAELLASMKYKGRGLRVGFDRIGEDGHYKRAVELLMSKGVRPDSMMSLVLFNYTDSPKEADYRMRVVAGYGIKPYPQCYVPLDWDLRSRFFVSEKWTRPLVDAFKKYWASARWTRLSFDRYLEKYEDRFGITPECIEKWRSE